MRNTKVGTDKRLGIAMPESKRMAIACKKSWKKRWKKFAVISASHEKNHHYLQFLKFESNLQL